MKKILVVDDRPDVLELVTVTLEVGPYQIFTAGNGPQALEIACRELPDLILLDVMMGWGPNGFEVCTHIKRSEATRDIIVIMLTAQGQEANIQAGYDAGADHYVVKPFSPLALIQKVEEMLA